MNAPHHQLRNRSRSNFVGPRLLWSRAILVELALLAILISLRNVADPASWLPAPTPRDTWSLCLRDRGTNASSQACISPLSSLSSGPGATTSVSIPIPNDAVFCGQGLSVQWVDLDITMPFALPLGTSRAGSFTIGL